MENLKTLVDGKYHYFEDDKNYAQEIFKFSQDTEKKSYHLNSEIMSRIQTGEFLKIIVNYSLSHLYAPQELKITRTLGSQRSEETFTVQAKTQEVQYEFHDQVQKQSFSRSFAARHSLATPAISSMGLFTLTRKLELRSRAAINIISTNNTFEFEKGPSEKILYAELVAVELDNFKIEQTPYKPTHINLFQHDLSKAVQESPVELYLSKHFGIPYMVKSGNQKIIIKQLKRHT